jgi:hypothetical protein
VIINDENAYHRQPIRDKSSTIRCNIVGRSKCPCRVAADSSGPIGA